MLTAAGCTKCTPSARAWSMGFDQLVGSDAPIRRGQPDELGAAGEELGRTAFVGIDMRVLGTEHAAVGRDEY